MGLLDDDTPMGLLGRARDALTGLLADYPTTHPPAPLPNVLMDVLRGGGPSVLDQMRAADAMRSHTGNPLQDARADMHNKALRDALAGIAMNFNFVGAARSTRIPTDGGRIAHVLEDANFADAARLAERSKHKVVRGFTDPQTGKSYVWDANDATHYHVLEQLGFDPSAVPDSAQWSVEAEVLPRIARALGLRGAP